MDDLTALEKQSSAEQDTLFPDLFKFQARHAPPAALPQSTENGAAPRPCAESVAGGDRPAKHPWLTPPQPIQHRHASNRSAEGSTGRPKMPASRQQ